MTEPKIIIHYLQECENPSEQVFFKRVELKDPIVCNDGDGLEVDWGASTATIEIKRNIGNPRSRKERLELSQACLIYNSCGILDFESRRLLSKWTFEIEKLEYIGSPS